MIPMTGIRRPPLSGGESSRRGAGGKGSVALLLDHPGERGGPEGGDDPARDVQKEPVAPEPLAPGPPIGGGRPGVGLAQVDDRDDEIGGVGVAAEGLPVASADF